MIAKLLKGKKVADRLKPGIQQRAAVVTESRGSPPLLAVLAVGGDAASQVYLRSKLQACKEAGVEATVESLPESASEPEILTLLRKLGADPTVDGILVERPLPSKLDALRITEAVCAEKDVEGVTTANYGRFCSAKTLADMRAAGILIPCTADAILQLLLETGVDVQGLEAVVVGRSNIVGRPTAHLLSCLNATVTLCHSRTRDLPRHLKGADIVVAAVGEPHFIQGGWLKPGAIVLDAGIHGAGPDIRGDVDFEAASRVASYITPVPGGVGPLTVICLLDHVVLSAERRTRQSLAS
ncbi:MAG: bifunctional 5,10-methylenetetrahydrofolate dehydrogenase/5,10-methenyltetrahydrofolate cyclohydrolase [Elusimicrobia bacterium]|nr:bifunctional 5,10-methylenetetrahydrofolate dehydrogenase/5,10-methenyltetrahydrofolate cyclohydrolase [Elusimicrobiota bacterium]